MKLAGCCKSRIPRTLLALEKIPLCPVTSGRQNKLADWARVALSSGLHIYHGDLDQTMLFRHVCDQLGLQVRESRSDHMGGKLS